MMEKINILVACHKDSYVPDAGGIIKSIQVGASMRGHISGMDIYDDSGDNISGKNDRYCELTAQYYAWKNIDCDYYGFFHYRRYLSFSVERYQPDRYNNVKYDRISDAFLSDFGVNEQSIRTFITGYDLIVPEAMDFKNDATLSGKSKTVYSHYKHSPGHDIADLDFALSYIEENLPEYTDAAHEYMKSRYCYFLNMYVMKKQLFFDYCSWLFPILEAFDAQKDYSNLSAQECRAVGFLAERLFGIYFYHLTDTQKGLKIRHTQQSLISDTEVPYPLPSPHERLVAVTLGCDENYVPFAGIVISSIIQNSSDDNFYDIFVVTNEVGEKSKNLLKDLINEKSNFSLRFICGDGYLGSKTLFEKHHINRSSYLRFAILDFMKNYDKVVYLDCDTVVNRDIAELYNTDINGYYFAAALDSVQSVWCSYKNSEQLAYNKKVVGIANGLDYYNAGVLVLNIKELRKDYSAESLYTIASARKWRWQDQDVLNHIAKDSRVLTLEGNWNVQVNACSLIEEVPEKGLSQSAKNAHDKGMSDPYIIHYAGQYIPCFYPEAPLADYFWTYAKMSTIYKKLPKGKERRKKEKGRIQRFADKLFPKGSRRREMGKRIYFFFARRK